MLKLATAKFRQNIGLEYVFDYNFMSLSSQQQIVSITRMKLAERIS